MVVSGLEGHDFRAFCFAGRAIAEKREFAVSYSA